LRESFTYGTNPMQHIDAREGARRQHRVIALFAVLQCWIRKLDGVVLNKSHLERLIGLKRIKRNRIRWFLEDVSEFFPYHREHWHTNSKDSFSYLVLSRLPFEEEPERPEGPSRTPQETTRDQAQGNDAGPRIDLLQLWNKPDPKELDKLSEMLPPCFSGRDNFDERLLSAYLALLVQGQISPTALTLPKLRPLLEE